MTARTGCCAWAFATSMFWMMPTGGATFAGFDCADPAGRIGQIVCGDAVLSALDLRLFTFYRRALSRLERFGAARKQLLQTLEEEHAQWARKRDACVRKRAMKSCVDRSYRSRIAELQATFRLLPARERIVYLCGSAFDVTVSYFDTDPASVVLTRDYQSQVALHGLDEGDRRYFGDAGLVFERVGSKAWLTWTDGTRRQCAATNNKEGPGSRP